MNHRAWKRIAAAAFVAAGLTCLACSQEVASAPPSEHAATESSRLAETGCTSVAIPGPNVSASDSHLTGGNCVYGTWAKGGNDYWGDASCPDQVVYELSDATGIWEPVVLFGGPMPTTQADCNLHIEYAVYGKDLSGNWLPVPLGVSSGSSMWFPQYNECGYGVWGGTNPHDIDMSQYKAIRIAASAYRYITVKGSQVKSLVPVEATASGQYCIW